MRSESRCVGAALAAAVAAGGWGAPQDAEGARTIPLPDDGASVSVWSEAAADGGTRHFYAVSLDGGARRTVRSTSYEILLRHDRFDPLVRQPQVPAALAADEAAAEGVYIVQFVTQPLDAYRRAIGDLGGVVHQYLANHCHLVRMSAATRAAVEALPFVRWVGPWHPAYRLDPSLLDGTALPARQRYNVMLFAARPAVRLAVADRIAAVGGRVDHLHAGKHLLEATLTPAQLFEAASWNEVMFIDRWSPWETDMNIARQIGGADFVESVAGFDGAGVSGEVLDVGFNTAHVDFQAQPLMEHTPVDSDNHGASTSGIIFGDGTGSPTARGMLPAGQGIIADLDHTFNGPGRYAHTGELLEAPYHAVFVSSSVGSNQTTEYTTISADLDAMLFDWDIIQCQSQSNTFNQNSRPQAWAKNVVSVGGVRHMDTPSTADDCWGCGPTGASIGPAADGRIKPDLSHFYDNIFTVSGGSPNSYTSSFGGTSGATPITCGHFGLVFQMWAEGALGYPVNPDATVFENRPHAATAKALVVNTAQQYDFAGQFHDLTRVHQGWGFANVQNLYELREKLFVINETVVLANLESESFELTVEAGEPAVRFTLVYADPPGNPASIRHRVNDLTLRVTDPVGTVYWGNNGLLTGNWSVAGGAPNTMDTVENVFVEDPQAGTWTAEVIADEINEDGHVETEALDADFALVVSGVAPAPPPLVMRVPEGVPELVAPQTETVIPVEIIEGAETLASATLFYRPDSGDSFTAIPMTPAGGVEYLAALPAAACGTTPQFYLAAEGDGGGGVALPLTAPDSVYEAVVGTVEAILVENFETAADWTVENEPGLTSGAWEQGVPIGGGDRGDPPSDFDGSGRCFLTENLDGDSDIDGGATWLISPAFDLAGLEPTVEYALWYDNTFGSAANQDVFRVDVSADDGATWVPAQTVGPVSGPGWSLQSLQLADFITPTSAVRVRFEASDDGSPSVVEAAVDAFGLTVIGCEAACAADLDGDGTVGTEDFLALLAAWGTDPGGPPDLDGDGTVGTEDLLALLAAWGPCP